MTLTQNTAEDRGWMTPTLSILAQSLRRGDKMILLPIAFLIVVIFVPCIVFIVLEEDE